MSRIEKHNPLKSSALSRQESVMRDGKSGKIQFKELTLEQIKDGLRRAEGDINKVRVKGSHKCNRPVCKSSCKYLSTDYDDRSFWIVVNICRLPKSIGFINKVAND